MYKAELRCTKYPIICTNQTGRSNLYCNGAIECEDQRATIEWDGKVAQKNGEAPETIDNTKVQICPKCKKGNLEMFDSNEDWCPKCKQTFPGKL